jgi:hypothetical protein
MAFIVEDLMQLPYIVFYFLVVFKGRNETVSIYKIGIIFGDDNHLENENKKRYKIVYLS